MNNLKYILILAIACLIFIAIDDVYAATTLIPQTQTGTCTYHQYSFYGSPSGTFYVDVECSANSSFYVALVGTESFTTCNDVNQGCTFVTSVNQYDYTTDDYTYLTGSFNHATILKDYSYYDFSAIRQLTGVRVLNSSTEYYFGNYPNYSSTPSIHIATAGRYFFAYQVSVMPGNQSPTIQSAFDSSRTNEKLDDLNQSIDETNDYLKDDTPPESDISALGNVQGLLPPGPVDSLLNIPFEFLSVLTTSFGGVCVPLSGTFVFDSTLTLPCFSDVFYDNVPPFLMNFINLIPAGFILIKYFKHLYKKVDRAMNMNANADDEWGVL